MAGHSQRTKVKHFKRAIDAGRAITKGRGDDRAAAFKLIATLAEPDDVKEAYSNAEFVE